jgi:microcystin degradation protein MlrC
MARIAVGGFMHESNSFVPGQTDFAKYTLNASDRPPLIRGEEMLEKLSNTSFSSAGFFELTGAKHELLPTVWASTLAGPPLSVDAFERIAAELVGRLSQLLPVDAVYLDLHGAMVSEPFEDGEGELLRRVRATVGADVPIVITLDYHCNFTEAMAAYSDAVCAYQTYPHIDQVETGHRAAVALESLLARGTRTVSTVRKMPFLLPLNFQCTMVQPTLGVVELVANAETDPILSAAYLAGFPPSDLFECGPAIVVHGFDAVAVEKSADRLARAIALKEGEFAEPLYTPEEAVREAMAIVTANGYSGKPVVIADTQDNPGAGGSGDTTGMLAALVSEGARDAVLGVLLDAQAATAAHAAGEGAEIEIELGGRTAFDGVRPYRGRFTVKRLGDGRYVADALGMHGREMNLGPCALLGIDGVNVVVSSQRVQARERGFLGHLGVDADEQRIIVLKSTCHFRADFQPIAETVLIAIAPGGHIGDPARYNYQKLRREVRLSPLGRAFGGKQ